MCKQFKRWFYFPAAAVSIFFLPHAHAGESVTEYLRRFHENPAEMMERLPSVVDENGEAHPQGFINQEAVAASFAYRTELRAQIANISPKDLLTAEPGGEKDSPEKLVDPNTGFERNLPAMQAQSLMNMVSGAKPWADSYWPTYRGQLGERYADRSIPKSKSWDVNYAHVMSDPASGIVSSGNTVRINMLSPAEKYDFVMGDFDFTLTRYSWAQGKKAKEEDKGVATWMGICHGWAAASHMGAYFIAEPTTVISQNGIPVTFYPQDIKALQSMLWANASPTSRFVSSRCSVSRPARNAYGRIVDSGCFDTNPASWHLAVVNQLGRNHRSFVFDGTYDAEVWNFPLVSARYRYFNPLTLEETQNWNQAVIPLSKYRADKFREFRSPSAANLVGIYMDVTYVIEIEPGISRTFDAPTKTVRYIYDLELDGDNNIVGGEWYSNAHPDFMWTFDNGLQAMARNDNVLLTDPWTNNGPVPLHWTQYARGASAYGIPLYAFLKKVIDAAGPTQQP